MCPWAVAVRTGSGLQHREPRDPGSSLPPKLSKREKGSISTGLQHPPCSMLAMKQIGSMWVRRWDLIQKMGQIQLQYLPKLKHYSWWGSQGPQSQHSKNSQRHPGLWGPEKHYRSLGNMTLQTAALSLHMDPHSVLLCLGELESKRSGSKHS